MTFPPSIFSSPCSFTLIWIELFFTSPSKFTICLLEEILSILIVALNESQDLPKAVARQVPILPFFATTRVHVGGAHSDLEWLQI